MKKLALLAGVGALLAQTAQAQDIDTYTPASVWAADYGDDYCRLLRDFSNGDDKITLMFERTHPNAIVRVLVVGDSIRLFRGATTVGYRFLPSGSERTGQRIVGEAPDGQQILNLGPATLAEPGAPGGGAFMPGGAPYSRTSEREAAAAIDGILLENGFTKHVQIETGSLGPVIEAMQACADDMLTVWGLDAATDATLTRPVVPGDGTAVPPAPGEIPQSPTAGWVRQGTVPFDQFRNLAGGANQVRLLVDASGKPTSCAVLLPVLPADTNASICEQVMANGKFQPALDANGQAVESYWVSSPMGLMPPFGGGRGGGRR